MNDKGKGDEFIRIPLLVAIEIRPHLVPRPSGFYIFRAAATPQHLFVLLPFSPTFAVPSLYGYATRPLLFSCFLCFYILAQQFQWAMVTAGEEGIGRPQRRIVSSFILAGVTTVPCH